MWSILHYLVRTFFSCVSHVFCISQTSRESTVAGLSVCRGFSCFMLFCSRNDNYAKHKWIFLWRNGLNHFTTNVSQKRHPHDAGRMRFNRSSKAVCNHDSPLSMVQIQFKPYLKFLMNHGCFGRLPWCSEVGFII